MLRIDLIVLEGHDTVVIVSIKVRVMVCSADDRSYGVLTLFGTVGGEWRIFVSALWGVWSMEDKLKCTYERYCLGG
jgi:hypothetical protein